MKREQRNERLILGIILTLGLAVRIILAYYNTGFETDINCFISWSERLQSGGFGSFYSTDVFSDYPPGYLYILYVVGGIRQFLHLADASFAHVLLIKMPSILCDLLTAVLIYRIGKKRENKRQRQEAQLQKPYKFPVLLFACIVFYIVNPMVLFDSAVWGQVDSIYVLCVISMCYFIAEEKLPLAYVSMAVGILIKPQLIFFGPVLLCGIVNQVFLEDFSWNKFWKNLASGVASILLIFLGMLPFGLGASMERYVGSVSTYAYDSVNAYNLYTLFGMNWQDYDQKFLGFTGGIWNVIFLILIVGLVLYMGIAKRKRFSVYFLAGVNMTAIFFLAASMHERYLYPAGVLFLIAYICDRRISTFLLGAGTCLVCFLNMHDVLYYYDANSYTGDRAALGIISFIMLLVFVYMCLEIHHRIREGGRTWKRDKREDATFGKTDACVLGAIVIGYSIVAFIHLGSTVAPQTYAKLSDTDMQVVMELKDNQVVSELDYYLENCDSKQLTIEFSQDGENWEWFCDSDDASAFRWTSIDMELDTRYIRITGYDPDRTLGEIVLLDENRKVIEPENASDYPNLFDEVDTLPDSKSKIESFYYGTYFDEIYHARTAFEYIHGMYSYENTHPPLGKILISVGIRLFGMNPFGWRVMGTLFGIFMLPVLYLFGKKLFEKTWLAAFVTLLFTFDFMHFAQTRISTIDVYVVFFILCEYYFMYRYMQMELYQTNRRKQYLTLVLCGLSMGLGIASKFTGIYAGVGLAVLFFWQTWANYRKERIVHPQVIRERILPTFAVCVGAFILIPAVVYVLSYLPFNDESGNGLLKQLWDNQISMVNYHTQLVDSHPFASYWYQWPAIVRPIWYFSGTTINGSTSTISSFGNPLVWWTGLVALIQTMRLWIGKRDKKAGFLVVAFMAQYLPWVFVPRTTFIYHYFACVPFMILMIGYCLQKWNLQKQKKYRMAAIYVIACGVLFFLFYPALSGQHISAGYVENILEWFTNWVFVS